MAIGFIPKEKAEYSIEGVPESNVIAALLHLLHQGQWHVELEGERFLVGDRSSAMSAGHTLELQWDEHYLSVVCKLNGNFTDFGTSKKVLKKFLDDFKLALENLSEHEVQHWYSQYTSVLENYRNDTGENQFKWWHIFIPGKGAIVTPVIFWINTLVFLIMQFGNLNEAFILLGANSFDTLNGQWWRLFTCMFLHGGFMHYAMNSFSLMILGFALERIIRAGIFSVIYLLSGIAAGVTSLWWHSYMSSVGASGAIFGLMGTLLALQLTSILTDESGKSRIGNTVLIIGLNLLYGLNEGIDNAAHIGGFVFRQEKSFYR
jgi:rhomboid protease GluP